MRCRPLVTNTILRLTLQSLASLIDPLQLQVDLARQRLEEVEATLEKLRCGRAKKTDAEVDGIPIDVRLFRISELRQVSRTDLTIL